MASLSLICACYLTAIPCRASAPTNTVVGMTSVRSTVGASLGDPRFVVKIVTTVSINVSIFDCFNVD